MIVQKSRKLVSKVQDNLLHTHTSYSIGRVYTMYCIAMHFGWKLRHTLKNTLEN